MMDSSSDVDRDAQQQAKEEKPMEDFLKQSVRDMDALFEALALNKGPSLSVYQTLKQLCSDGPLQQHSRIVNATMHQLICTPWLTP